VTCEKPSTSGSAKSNSSPTTARWAPRRRWTRRMRTSRLARACCGRPGAVESVVPINQ